MFKTGPSPMMCVNELTLKLARKCLDVFGSGIFEDEATYHTLSKMSFLFPVLNYIVGRLISVMYCLSLTLKSCHSFNLCL